MNPVESQLHDFRKTLPDTSETARLIDIRADLDEITEAAEGESLLAPLLAMLAKVGVPAEAAQAV